MRRVGRWREFTGFANPTCALIVVRYVRRHRQNVWMQEITVTTVVAEALFRPVTTNFSGRTILDRGRNLNASEKERLVVG